jgi:hypothetical protein
MAAVCCGHVGIVQHLIALGAELEPLVRSRSEARGFAAAPATVTDTRRAYS